MVGGRGATHCTGEPSNTDSFLVTSAASLFHCPKAQRSCSAGGNVFHLTFFFFKSLIYSQIGKAESWTEEEKFQEVSVHRNKAVEGVSGEGKESGWEWTSAP